MDPDQDPGGQKHVDPDPDHWLPGEGPAAVWTGEDWAGLMTGQVEQQVLLQVEGGRTLAAPEPAVQKVALKRQNNN